MKTTWPHAGRYLVVPVVLLVRAYALPAPAPDRHSLIVMPPDAPLGIWTGKLPDGEGKPLLATLTFTGLSRMLVQLTDKKGVTVKAEGSYHQHGDHIMASWSNWRNRFPAPTHWPTGFYGQKQGNTLQLIAPPLSTACSFTPAVRAVPLGATAN